MRKKYVFNLTNLFFELAQRKLFTSTMIDISKIYCKQENLLFYPFYCWTFYIETCSQCKNFSYTINHDKRRMYANDAAGSLQIFGQYLFLGSLVFCSSSTQKRRMLFRSHIKRNAPNSCLVMVSLITLNLYPLQTNIWYLDGRSTNKF